MSLVTQVRLPDSGEGAWLLTDEPNQVFSLLLLYQMRPNLRTREKNNDSFIKASAA